jgi:hypothetical protein
MKGDRAFSEDAHRYLDGAHAGQLSAAERAAAERLVAEAAAYAERLEPVSPALDEAVMAAVRRHPHPGRGGTWDWLVTPRPIRVRPVWLPALAAAAALAVWLVPKRSAPRTPAVASRVAAVADTVYVRFELVAPEAHSVSVAGSFNGWRAGALPLTRVADGLWATTVALPVGEHRYEFVVDGTRWVPDPTAHAQVDDGFGGRNSVIVVGPKGLVRS